MTIPDINILVHAHNEDSPDHARARDWWQFTVRSGALVGLPWATILGFIRVATHRRASSSPLVVEEATRLVRAWLRVPSVTVVTPGDGHLDVLIRLLDAAGTAGNLTTDAHLAALALEHDAEVATTDRDFARFPGVRWFNPIT